MKRNFAIILGLLLVFPLLKAEDTDVKYTNDSVARVSNLSGNAFIQRASDVGYEECVLNTPITEGDRLGTTEGRAEVYFGRANYIRMDNETKIDFLNLPKKDDELVRIRVWSGSIYLDVAGLAKEKDIEIHTADTSFYILDKGLYRIDVKENTETEILVFRGLIEAAGEDGSILIKAGQRLEVAEGRFSSRPSQFVAAANDAFDRWNDTRSIEVTKLVAKQYLPTELEDFEYELGQYGDWMNVPPYGNVWVPRGMGDDWRPYYNGRWTWLPLTSWTWIPYEPWGWAPFHYGRWHWGVGMGWYWIPTSFWGPGWVDWWWDNDYFAWAPLSWWGYPGVFMDGRYYGDRAWDRYPHNSRALTVIRRDQLRAGNISQVALRGDSLKGLTSMSLSNKTLTLRPVGSKTFVQPITGKKIMLRNDGSSSSLKDSGASVGSTRSIRSESLGSGRTAKSGEAKSDKASSSSRTKSERKIRKKDGGSDTSFSRSGGAGTSVNGSGITRRGDLGYPSSSTIGRGRYIREYDNPWRNPSLGGLYRYFSGDRYTSSSRGSSSSGSRITSRSSGSRSSGSRSSVSRGSSSRGSSGSHSSGGVHTKR
jgi:hypothetical protein